jgi:hypothetical protein
MLHFYSHFRVGQEAVEWQRRWCPQGSTSDSVPTVWPDDHLAGSHKSQDLSLAVPQPSGETLVPNDLSTLNHPAPRDTIKLLKVRRWEDTEGLGESASRLGSG